MHISGAGAGGPHVDVRAYTVDMMGDLGYEVISAHDGPSSLQLLDAHPGIGLLFSDVGLPGGMNGRQLADAAMRRGRASKSCSRPAMPATRLCITAGSIRVWR